MITNPFTRQFLVNANEEGCNQHTGPNCGGRVVRSSYSSPTNRNTRVRPIHEDVHRVTLVDSNEDQLRQETLSSEEEAMKTAIDMSKFYKLGIDKKRFKEAGYFKNRAGVRLYKNPDMIPLGEEEEGEDFPARTNLDRGHIQRIMDKIKAKRKS